MKPTSSSKLMRSETLKEEAVGPYALKEVSGSLGPSIGGTLSMIERDAYERGFASGERAGSELGLKKIEAARQTLVALIEGLTSLKEEYLAAAEGDIFKIAIAAARRILRQEIEQSPEKTLRYIQEAIKKIGQAEIVTLRVHPQDMERLTKERTSLAQLIETTRWLKFEPDAHLLPGDCVVESADRMVDARIDAQLSLIEQELKRTME